jgi:hypothetical protein
MTEVLRKQKQMTSKERVLLTFSRQVPDRVPVNYSSNPGIHSRVLKHCGLGADEDEALLQVLGIDFRAITPPYIGPRLFPEEQGRRVDKEWGTHTRWVSNASGGYWDFCDYPISEATVEEIAAMSFPSPDDYDYNVIPDMCSKYRQYACYYGGSGLVDVINQTNRIRGVEQTLVDLLTDDPACLLYMDRKCAVYYEVFARSLEIAKGKIDFLWIGEDLGMQDRPLISMEMFRKHIKPRHQPFIDLAKSYGLPVMIHSCGSSSWAYDEFIDMGINVVDTLQPEAKDMSPAYLKSRFGDRLAFHGCISTGGPLASGTEDEVIQDVKNTLEVMMPGGGYCLAPTHWIQDNTPAENVVAMYRAAHEYGKY